MVRRICWLVFLSSSILAPLAAGGPSAVSTFDHQATGFPLVGAHARAACHSCHAEARFVGVPRHCDGCHRQGGLINATAQPPFHIEVSGRCADCHQQTLWQPVLWVDHDLVLGTCSSCHNNARVAGQPPTHFPTSAECDSCHNVRRWSR